MTCLRCLKARRAVAAAIKAAVKGSIETAASQARAAGAEIAAKVKDALAKLK
ncbi:hypothetical protein [Xanthobacter agilis]|uniref:Uncharacterized protein n=1 Tax=Xanthobacter agilis TaxID=47492 RepID=A0ABU0LFN3_XANAG|nr:hypothetical protein [Xanthobacter agilis]MDQ0505954.1 hypothetical protein [Xanthobacter agilis]